MPKYFDIHSHLNFPEYNSDRSEAIERLETSDTGTICVGTSLETSKESVDLAERNENIFASIGVHPVDDAKAEFDKESFCKLVQNKKVVAIGECGLDFFHAKKEEDFERQRKLFIDQIEFALEFDLPIMIHARNAYEEILEILEPRKSIHGEKLRGNVHFFAGNLGIAKRFIEIDFTLSFTGVITFTDDYSEVIKSVPLEMIMSETDSPYVSPVPYRGKRNEPSYVGEVAKKIAEIRGENLEDVEKTLILNVKRVFGI